MSAPAQSFAKWTIHDGYTWLAKSTLQDRGDWWCEPGTPGQSKLGGGTREKRVGRGKLAVER